MRKPASTRDSAEPIGIIIAGPERTADVVPRVLAYVWGPAPEAEADAMVERRAERVAA